MAGIAVCFAIAAAMSQIDSSAWVPTFFITTMINVIIITVFCAIFQASLVSYILAHFFELIVSLGCIL